MAWCYKSNFKTKPQDSKLQKENHAIMSSNMLIVKMTTKWIILTVPFGNISLTRNGTTRRYKSSKKLELIQFA